MCSIPKCWHLRVPCNSKIFHFVVICRDRPYVHKLYISIFLNQNECDFMCPYTLFIIWRPSYKIKWPPAYNQLIWRPPHNDLIHLMFSMWHQSASVGQVLLLTYDELKLSLVTLYFRLYSRVNALKLQNPKLKVLLAMGGWNAGSEPYSNMAFNSTSRREFIVSSIKFLRNNSFDGLDLDWEYPAQRGGKPADYNNFAILIQVCHLLQLRYSFKNLANNDWFIYCSLKHRVYCRLFTN